MTWAEWCAGGSRIAIQLGGVEREIFRRVEGSGPWLTLLHGWPTSSYDWSHVAPRLAATRKLLAFDFLGFGDSDKPTGHRYDLLEHADTVEAIWRAEGVTETAIAAHDIGVSVAKELLTRVREGKLATRITAVTMSNGILFEDQHRALVIQKLLLNGVLGPILSRLSTEGIFRGQFANAFTKEHRLSKAEVHEHWLAIANRGGSKIGGRLIQFIRDGHREGERWAQTIAALPAPTRFIWGMADPVAGAQMIDELVKRVPDANIVRLADVGHYPHISAPDQVADAILEHLT